MPRFSYVAALLLLLPAEAASAQAPSPVLTDKPVDLGEGGFATNGMVERLAPHWIEVATCGALTVDLPEERQIHVAAWSGTPDKRVHFDLACTIEDHGHRIVAAVRAEASHPELGPQGDQIYLLIELAGGDRIVTGGGAGSFRETGTAWLYPNFRTVWNAETGRSWTVAPSRQGPAGRADHPVRAWLLGAPSSFDPASIGLGGGGPVVPTDRDLEAAFLARVQQTYPALGCARGFRSALLPPLEIVEVCVNFNAFEVRSCDPGARTGAALVCTLGFTVIVGTSTHPQYNEMFAELAQPWEFTDVRFVHRDATGWSWDGIDDDIHGLVPTQFREYYPFGR